MDTPVLRKSRGAFFTPPAVSEFLTSWAIRGATDRVLEPACGDAAFLIPASKRLQALGSPDTAPHLDGFDIHEQSLRQAAQRLRACGLAAKLQAKNFFDVPAAGGYDAVVGNPPFVRYQAFAGDARLKALQAALAQGVRLNGLASSWAAFAVHAVGHLKPGGRLALVLPAELLTVGYAGQVREFLMRRFSSVSLVVFDQLVFEDALEEVVLLLAEGDGGTRHFKVYRAGNASELANPQAFGWTAFAPAVTDKWTTAFVSPAALELYDSLLSTPAIERLSSWGGAYLGTVTGNNAYFALTKETARAADLSLGDLLPISPPGARHLRDLSIARSAWQSLCDGGARAFLFAPSVKSPSAAALRYIVSGEKAGVDTAYKCRVRSPWWQVPLVASPDLLFTYMNHDRPRLTTNASDLRILNSLYGVSLKAGRKTLGRELLPLASLNSITALGAEIVGRSFGGGLLKHEPREADRIPSPSYAAVKAAQLRLRALKPEVAKELRAGNSDRATALVDQVLLRDHMGLDGTQLDLLRQARRFLFERRSMRAKGGRGEVR